MEIPDDIARSEGVPEDLDASAGGPYRMPSPRRRRMSGIVLLVVAAGVAALSFLDLPDALIAGALGLALLGLYHLATGWELGISERSALELANREVGFPVGHASAALGYQGWRSRPVWNVLVYEAEDPPSRRGLVRVDAREGQVMETYVEEIPPAG